MPKDADVLTNFLPVKDNIYWLYRYHCTASIEYAHHSNNKLKNSPYVWKFISIEKEISIEDWHISSNY